MASKRLTKSEVDALVIAATFLLAGEWAETISAQQCVALRRAVVKLKSRSAKSGTQN